MPPSNNNEFVREDRHMTARLEERVKTLQDELKDFQRDYVTRSEFRPVQRAVYAAIGIILTGALGFLFKLPGVFH